MCPAIGCSDNYTTTWPSHAEARRPSGQKTQKLVVRKDDNPDTVKDRLVVYHRETEPLIAFYEKKGLLRRIDGDQGPDKNAAAFKAAM